ncbi:histidine--tRNA ligase [Candidatus Woesearchaeota archaeon]|nr:histidine--tRNA ligase [Candidatus Woesearchaeota archaeon]|tara:strand:+ start:652 stop:1932 length:1281 start_codon:yes stop_codon:yes gene_type:complete
MNLQTAKGVQDIPPEEAIIRQRIITTIREAFERYGYAPLETPTFELFEVLASKYSGGAEILKETFQFNDQGKRKLALRYDLTVPFSRFVGMNPQLKMPFKRYEMGRVYRDGPIKKGRMREFWQCDADVVGTRSMAAEAELLLMAVDVFEKLKIDITLKVNNRKLLNGFVAYVGAKKDATKIILSLDKLAKQGRAEVKKELLEIIPEEKAEKLLTLVQTKGTFIQIKKVFSVLNEEAQEGLKELEELFSLTQNKRIIFDPGLARGLAYYTGTVFEAFCPQMGSSLGAGGRYDRMIADFLERKEDVPTVGFSFGIEPITVVVGERETIKRKTPTDLFVIPIGTAKEAFAFTQSLREKGIKADLDLIGRGISKNLSYANGLAIPYVVILGETELKEKKVKIKNMESGKEELVDMDKVAKKMLALIKKID